MRKVGILSERGMRKVRILSERRMRKVRILSKRGMRKVGILSERAMRKVGSRSIVLEGVAFQFSPKTRFAQQPVASKRASRNSLKK